MCRTLRRLGVPVRDVPDVAHEAFVAVHSRLPDYDPTQPLRPWLFAFAFRVAAKYRDRMRRGGEVSHETPDLVDDRPGPDEKLSSEQTRQLVLLALDALELDRRAVLVMHELDDVAIPDVVRDPSGSRSTRHTLGCGWRERILRARGGTASTGAR